MSRTITLGVFGVRSCIVVMAMRPRRDGALHLAPTDELWMKWHDTCNGRLLIGASSATVGLSVVTLPTAWILQPALRVRSDSIVGQRRRRHREGILRDVEFTETGRERTVLAIETAPDKEYRREVGGQSPDSSSERGFIASVGSPLDNHGDCT